MLAIYEWTDTVQGTETVSFNLRMSASELAELLSRYNPADAASPDEEDMRGLVRALFDAYSTATVPPT